MADAEDAIRRLPSGPHGIAPELIERNQRERLISAMAELCGERGYGETAVAEVAKRAGVSTASFYRQFEDKRACMLASFEELFGRLCEALAHSCAPDADTREKARAGAAVVADLLRSDLPTARLLSLEILAVGSEGVRAQHDAIERLAGLLRSDDLEAGSEPDAAWAVVAAMTALVGKRASDGRAPDLTELEAIAEGL